MRFIQAMLASIGAVSLFIMILLIIVKISHPPAPKQDVIESYQKQITLLNDVYENLLSLINYVQLQQKSLAEKQNILMQMEEDRKRMEPILKADQEQVENILESAARHQRKDIWIDRAISFLLGVASSSLVAAAVIVYQGWRKPQSVK